MMHRTLSNIEEVAYCFSRSSVKFQGHTGKKIADFDLNWLFPDCISSLNLPMALKCCTKLDIVYKGCPTFNFNFRNLFDNKSWYNTHGYIRDINYPIVFQGRLSNFKVTQDKKTLILTKIGRFRTVTPVWIHWWLWNDSQSLKRYRKGALSFLAATKQLYKWYFPSVRHTFLSMFPSSYHHEIFRSYYQWPT